MDSSKLNALPNSSWFDHEYERPGMKQDRWRVCFGACADVLMSMMIRLRCGAGFAFWKYPILL